MRFKAREKHGDRLDGKLLTGLDSMHVLMPEMMPNRTDNEAFIQESIDVTALEQWLAKKNETNPEHRYTYFHAMVAALGRTVSMRPKMNWFIKGGRYYQRHAICFAFVAKKTFTDHSAEGVAILEYDPESKKSSIDEMHDKITDYVYKIRSAGGSDSSTDTMDIITKMPHFLVRLLMKILYWLDEKGRMPKSLMSDDPYESTVFISNIGSLKMRAGYHHLANWGTNSVFVLMGEKHLAPVYDENGTVSMRPFIDIGITLDERIADGYYYSKTIQILKHLLTNPELLDTPACEEVVIDG